MYQINIDGTEQTELAQGRKFILTINDKYLTYIDYAEQEAKHILNLETKEDVLVGYFGEVKTYAGNTYINIRKRLDDGSIDEKYTLFEVKEDGTANEIGQYADFGTDLNYIINDKAYISNQNDGTSTINLKDGENSQQKSIIIVNIIQADMDIKQMIQIWMILKSKEQNCKKSRLKLS